MCELKLFCEVSSDFIVVDHDALGVRLRLYTWEQEGFLETGSRLSWQAAAALHEKMRGGLYSSGASVPFDGADPTIKCSYSKLTGGHYFEVYNEDGRDWECVALPPGALDRFRSFLTKLLSSSEAAPVPSFGL